MHRDTTRAGRIALVAGEAGIGKSALIRAFADRCGARWTRRCMLDTAAEHAYG